MFKYPWRDERGVAMVECAIVFTITFLLIFMLIQLALLGNAASILSDAAQAAARAESVGKSGTAAAYYVCGGIPFVRPGPLSGLAYGALVPGVNPHVSVDTEAIGQTKVIKVTVTYRQNIFGLHRLLNLFRGIFELPAFPFVTLRSTCRMPKEPDIP